MKRLVDVGETFPALKRARLGAAPPVDDVLDNVGAPEVPVSPAMQSVRAVTEQVAEHIADDAHQAKSAKKKERDVRRGGQGVHKGKGTDARRYRTTGRTYPFGVRVKAEFAERVKVMAGETNVTIGELLEDMEKIYKDIKTIAADKDATVSDLLNAIRKGGKGA